MSLYFLLFQFSLSLPFHVWCVCVCTRVGSLFFNVLPPSCSLQCINFYISEIRVAFVKIFVRAKNSFFYTLNAKNICVWARCGAIHWYGFLVCAAHCCCVRVSWKYKTEWAGKIGQTSTHVEPSSSTSSSNSGSIEILPTKTNLDPTTTTVAAATTATATNSTIDSSNTRNENNIYHNFDGSNKEINTEYKKPNAHTTSQPTNHAYI